MLSFWLEPEDGGGTRVEIVHHGFERLGQREVYESFEDGWDLSELDGLKRAVEDR